MKIDKLEGFGLATFGSENEAYLFYILFEIFLMRVKSQKLEFLDFISLLLSL